MAVTDIDVCAGALVMIGAEPLTSFTEDTDEGRVAANLYNDTKRAEMARYRWRFCMAFVDLSRLAAEPDNKWSAAYQIPDTVLHIGTIYSGNRRIDFDRYQDKIYCNAESNETITLEGHFEQDEQYWPPYFVQYMKLRMAALFAEALAAKTDLANTFEDKAERYWRIARNADSQGRTAARMDRGRITTRRFRSGSQYAGQDYY